MWYYMMGSERCGPISDMEMARKKDAKIITLNTLVWKEGMKEWVKLEETELGENRHIASLLQPDSNPSTSSITDLKNLKSDLNNSFKYYWIFFAVIVGSYLLSFPLVVSSTRSSFFLILPYLIQASAPAMGIMNIYFLIICWRAIPREYALMTPFKAILLSVIPIANIVMAPIAYYRLIKSLETYGTSKAEVRNKVNPKVFIASILAMMSAVVVFNIPYISGHLQGLSILSPALILAVISFILYLISFVNIRNATVELLNIEIRIAGDF